MIKLCIILLLLLALKVLFLSEAQYNSQYNGNIVYDWQYD